MKSFIYFSTLLLFISCSKKETLTNKFSDSEILRIADLQDRRHTDSLLLYFASENKKYRKEAVLAFASLQDTLAINDLSKLLLTDVDAGVRTAAAFALGQTGSEKSFPSLLEGLSTEKDEAVCRSIIEACGKTATAEGALKLLILRKPNLDEAFAWSYYRLGLRGLATPEVVDAAYKLLMSSDTKTLLAASHFFARTAIPDFKDEKALLRKAAVNENVFIRIAATHGLRNVKTDSARIIIQQNTRDKDERVRLSAIRALRSFTFSEVSDTFLKLCAIVIYKYGKLQPKQ